MKNNRKSQLIEVADVSETNPLVLIKDLRVSGLTGYPAITFTTTEYDKYHEVVSQLLSNIHLDGLTEQTLTFTLESNLHVSLKFKIVKALG